MKTCACCKERKSFDEFHKASNRKDGYHPYCKRCRKFKYAQRNSPERLKILILRNEGKKICARCKEVKSFSEFARHKKSQDGYHYYCVECRKIIEKEYYYSDLEKSRESARNRRKRWLQNPTNLEKVRRLALDAYHKNPSFSNQKRKMWRKTPKGRRKLLLQLQRRRNKEQNIINTLEDWHIILLRNLQGNKCAKCKNIFNENRPYSLDHIVPMSKGGGLELNNVQLLCKPCNSSKGVKTIQYRPNVSKYYSWVT